MLVQRQATFRYPVSSRILSVLILRTSIFLLTAGILKGRPLLRMHRDAGCWQPKQRLARAATSNRLPRTYITCRVSTLGAPIIKRKNVLKTQSGQSTYFVCTSSTIQSAPDVFLYFNSACMLFFNLVQKACLLLLLIGYFLCVGL